MLRLLADAPKLLLTYVPVGLLYFFIFCILELVYRVLRFLGLAAADLDYLFVLLGGAILAGDIIFRLIQVKVLKGK